MSVKMAAAIPPNLHILLYTVTLLLFPSKNGFNSSPTESHPVTYSDQMDVFELTLWDFWTRPQRDLPFLLLPLWIAHPRPLWRAALSSLLEHESQALQPTASADCQTCERGHLLASNSGQAAGQSQPCEWPQGRPAEVLPRPSQSKLQTHRVVSKWMVVDLSC